MYNNKYRIIINLQAKHILIKKVKSKMKNRLGAMACQREEEPLILLETRVREISQLHRRKTKYQ